MSSHKTTSHESKSPKDTENDSSGIVKIPGMPEPTILSSQTTPKGVRVDRVKRNVTALIIQPTKRPQSSPIQKWPELTIDRVLKEFTTSRPGKHRQLRQGLEELSLQGFDLRDVASCLYSDPWVLDHLLELRTEEAGQRIKKRLSDSRDCLEEVPFETIAVFLRHGFSICDVAWIARNMLDLTDHKDTRKLKAVMATLHLRFAHGGQKIHDINTYLPKTSSAGRSHSDLNWRDPFEKPSVALSEDKQSNYPTRAGSPTTPEQDPNRTLRASVSQSNGQKGRLASKLLLALVGALLLSISLFYGLYGFVDGRGVIAMAAIAAPCLFGLGKQENAEKTLGIIFLCILIIVLWRVFNSTPTDDYNRWPSF